MTTGAGRLQVEVLGPIRVVDAGGRDLTPEGPLQRRLLALLVLRRGRVVSADSAIDVLWPSQPPREPVAALQNHLFRLRRVLPTGLIESVADGYRLDPAGIELDADRLTAALQAASASDPAALALTEGLLDGWHGPAYPELDDVEDGRAEAVRLAELRVRARELHIEHRLATAATDGLVADVATLVEAEPLRERPRALLMGALAATGRQVEALRVYDDYRRLIGDELGIEPSPALAAQHARLLRGEEVDEWRPATRLPVPATSLVGREALAHDLVSLAGAHRLVSLVGPGGVGKTRLLVELGHRLRSVDPERPVVLAELAAATPTSAADAVASALQIDVRPGTPSAVRVADVLDEVALTLLVDNCEHVLDPAAELVERLLARCPNVRVVATSRERLRVPGEQVCVVPMLPHDDGHTPAVQLFVERARAAAPAFAPDERALERITEIVRRLDGLPLAIELAAARLHTHDLDEVASGLDRRFTLLSSGYRTSSRHGSLSAAVSWSVGLLDDHLQQTFANLSVFAGAFTAADAAAICAVDAETAVADLAQLTERSLVTRAPQRRYVMLETLRAYGSDQLAVAGRAGEVAERHARHQVDWIERARARLVEPDQPVLAEIDAAIPELRAALDWLLDEGRVELAGRLVVGLLDYGFLRLRPDVLGWAERVAAADPDDRSPMAAEVWIPAAYAAWMAGDVPESGRRSARALQVAERAGGPISAPVSGFQGTYALFEGRLEEAADWYRRAADAAAEQDPVYRFLCLGSLLLALGYGRHAEAGELADRLVAEVGRQRTPYGAWIWYCAGEADLSVDVERARRRLSLAIDLAEATHASFVTGLAGASKASIDARWGDPAVAADDYRRLIVHWRRAGMWPTQWTMLRSLAILLERLGHHRDAAGLEGAIRATSGGHRIFGVDEVALLELGERLQVSLGAEAYAAARRAGAELDGDAAVELALHAL